MTRINKLNGGNYRNYRASTELLFRPLTQGANVAWGYSGTSRRYTYGKGNGLGSNVDG